MGAILFRKRQWSPSSTCVTFDEECELVRDDWLDEIVEVAHVDAGVSLRLRSDVQTVALQQFRFYGRRPL